MRTVSGVLVMAAILCGAGAAMAAGSGGGSVSVPTPRPAQTPADRARSAYDSGVRAVKKADEQEREAAKATDVSRQAKAVKRAGDGYRKALSKFEAAVKANPSMHEAWNYVGYTKRKLGDYEAALRAYDQALALRPGYPEAIEYRGEAYMRLNRLDEAKQAYLELYAGNRALSDQLLAAMRDWIAAQRAGSPVDPTALDAFEAWVQERATIASQTAALTRDGAAAAWK
jgi:tetratricopeptide (TPR) repeat protein